MKQKRKPPHQKQNKNKNHAYTINIPTRKKGKNMQWGKIASSTDGGAKTG